MNSIRVHIEDAEGNKKTIWVHDMFNLGNVMKKPSEVIKLLDNHEKLYLYEDEGKYFCHDLFTDITIELTKEEFEIEKYRGIISDSNDKKEKL